MMSLGLGLKVPQQTVMPAGKPSGGASYSNEYSLYFGGTEAAGILDGTDMMNIFRGNHTYSFWVWDASYSVGRACGAFTFASPNYDIGVRFISVGTIYVQPFLAFNSTGSAPFYNVTSALTTYAWHQITVTCEKGSSDSDKSTVKIYVDGSLVGTNTEGPTKQAQEAFTPGSSTKFGIGARYNEANSPSNHTSAFYDEFAFWSTALDADAVAAIYNNGSSIDLSEDSGDYDNSSDLQSWYRLENDFTDSQGNSTTGTAYGNPTFVSSTQTLGVLTPGTP